MPSVAANARLQRRDPGSRNSRRLQYVLVGLAIVAFGMFVAFGGCSSSEKQRKFEPLPRSGLAASLERPPKFSTPGGSEWARDYTPTTGQFLDRFYGSGAQDDARASLKKQGLRELAHILWFADAATQCDIVLMRFDNVTGAADRIAFATAPVRRTGALANYQIPLVSGGTALPVTEAPTVYYTTQADSRGFRQARTYVQVGKVVVEMFVSTSKDLSRPAIERWLRGQLTRLG